MFPLLGLDRIVIACQGKACSHSTDNSCDEGIDRQKAMNDDYDAVDDRSWDPCELVIRNEHY